MIESKPFAAVIEEIDRVFWPPETQPQAQAAVRVLKAAGKVDKELAIKTLRRLYHPMFQETGRPVSVPIFDTIMPLLEALPSPQVSPESKKATKLERFLNEDRNPALPDSPKEKS